MPTISSKKYQLFSDTISVNYDCFPPFQHLHLLDGYLIEFDKSFAHFSQFPDCLY